MSTADLWKLLAGLGLFLYGMFLLEESIRQAEGRRFKLMLKKYSGRKLSAIFGGTLITGILQSSSVVNLLLLSFVGAGMVTMRNALAVLLGSNIGGTFNSWLVAMLGFKVDLGDYSLVFIAIASIALVVFRSRQRLMPVARFVMGVGLLFLGLAFVKEGMDQLVKDIDLSDFAGYPLIVYLLLGFVVTVLVQTSAATIVLVLGALNAGMIPIITGVAMVLGAELGTTLKINFGSIGGNPAKKRVAAGNSIFNMATTLLGFLFITPLVRGLSIVFTDPLLVLVSFQTAINLAGAFLFYFLLGYLGDFLERRFTDTRAATRFLQNTSPEMTDTALEMLEKEVRLFLQRVIRLNMDVFTINSEGGEEKTHAEADRPPSSGIAEEYLLIKQAEGEIVSFYSRMNLVSLGQENLLRLNQLMACVRNAMYSAKGMKDIFADRRELSNSGNEHKYRMYQAFQEQLAGFYARVNLFLRKKPQEEPAVALYRLSERLGEDHEKVINILYRLARKNELREVDLSTILNLNRELYSSGKAIIEALRNYNGAPDAASGSVPVAGASGAASV
jgi:phosphate:Na+ symporter